MGMTELFHLPNRIKVDCPWITEAKYFEKVDSTQDRITQFLPKTEEGAVLMLAETQTKGVGRLGRTWISPPGGIWFTLGLPLKKMELAQVAPFSVVVALQCINALQEVNNLKGSVKWPNDLLYEGKKLGGIILGTTTKYKRGWLLVGVGINVNNDLPANLKDATTIKQIRGQTQGRSRLIEAILNNIWNAWTEFDRTGFGPYQKAVEDKLDGKGESAKIAIGKKTVSGTLLGVDPQGSLLLKSNSKTQTVLAGEIVGQPT